MPALHTARCMRTLRLIAPLTLAFVGLAACQAGASSGPIVYTAPPDILNRSYPPLASGSPGDSAAPSDAGSVAPSDAQESASTVDQLPAEPPASADAGSSVRLGHPDPGTILFGTGAGTDSCSVANPTTVLLSTQPLFFAAHLADQMDGTKAIVLRIVKDGRPLVDHEEPADGKAFDCYGNTSPLGMLQPGAYDFKVTQGTTLEAEGNVTVR